MPFRSEKQRRYLWKHEPKIAREWTDEYGSKPQPKKKKKGGRIKKNGPVRPIHIPWDSQKKKRGGTRQRRKRARRNRDGAQQRRERIAEHMTRSIPPITVR